MYRLIFKNIAVIFSFYVIFTGNIVKADEIEVKEPSNCTRALYYSIIEDLIDTDLSSKVIVTLKQNFEAPGKKKKLNPEDIKKLQEKFLSTLPPESFMVDHQMTNVPVLFGRINFDGMKSIIGNSMVLSIEKDEQLELNQ